MTNALTSCPSYESLYPQCPSYESLYPNRNDSFTDYSGVELDRPPAFNPEYVLTGCETGSTLNKRSVDDVTSQVKHLKQECKDKIEHLMGESKKAMIVACVAAIVAIAAILYLAFPPLLLSFGAIVAIAIIATGASIMSVSMATFGCVRANEANKLK